MNTHCKPAFPLTCRRTGLRFWSSACTWRSSTNGTCSGSAPQSLPWIGRNPCRSTSAHTHPCPLRSCCKGAQLCQGSLCFGSSSSSLDWGLCTPDHHLWARWTYCASAPFFHASWVSWLQHYRTSLSANRPPCGSLPAAASKSLGCKILIRHGTCRTHGQAPTPPWRVEKWGGGVIVEKVMTLSWKSAKISHALVTHALYSELVLSVWLSL